MLTLLSPAELNLTTKDLVLLRHLALGRNAKEIGPEVGKSAKTVEWDINGTDNPRSLCAKLGTSNRADLVRYAVEHRLVQKGEQAIDRPRPKLEPLEVKGVEDLKAAILRGATLAANNQADVLQTNALCQCSDAYIRVARFQLEHR